MMNGTPFVERRRRFIEAYGQHRAEEGYEALSDAELLALPYLQTGPLAAMWRIRARTFRVFEHEIVNPLADALKRRLTVLDAGAGNGWLSYRLCLSGHHCTAFDLRASGGDSLQTASRYASHLPTLFRRSAGDFSNLPFADQRFDIVAFNASLHYALDLTTVLSEAQRVLHPNGRIAILDSPFYASRAHGEAMVEEKRRNARLMFGDRSDVLLSLPFLEYLTEDRLRSESKAWGINWSRYRVRYPLRYELRWIVSALKRKRPPSRFDLWVGRVSSRHG
jgi:SAM-dependent methyltransferase